MRVDSLARATTKVVPPGQAQERWETAGHIVTRRTLSEAVGRAVAYSSLPVQPRPTRPRLGRPLMCGTS
eukprot:12042743-Alexandrium_andersonii.AAC.1